MSASASAAAAVAAESAAPRLRGAVVVVTGASSGIGRATAVRLAVAHGAVVVAAARRAEALAALVAEVAAVAKDTPGCGRVVAVECDVTKRASVRALAEKARAEAQAEEEAGEGEEGKKEKRGIDVWINNAGVMLLSPFAALCEDEWEQMIDVNIKGVLNGVAAVLPEMLERGAGDIVNVSSDAGRKIFPTAGVYCASKAAVESITQGLRLENAAKGVRFTSIQPGATESELVTHITDPGTKEFLAANPIDLLKADDVARSICYALEQPRTAAVSEVLIRPTTQPQ